jgi:hypothetical protein
LIFLAAYVFVLSRQDYWKLLAILAFANLPMIFMAPLGLVAVSFPLLAKLLEFILVLWVFNLNLIAVSTICNISKPKATLLYLLVPLAFSYFVASMAVNLFSGLIF